MNKRFFSFGCSFTSLWWPTWNDYIGLNFDEYHTRGCGGADNKNILYRLLEVDKKYKFTSDDTIMVMFTSFNRMSYIDDKFHIRNIGDIVNHNLKNHPMGMTYNFETAVYDNCIAIQSIKSILDSKNIKYEFLQSMEWNFYKENFEMGGEVKDHLEYCLDLFKYPVMENWCYENYDFDKEKVTFQDTGHEDGHPLPHHHLDFVKTFFPHFINDKVIQFHEQQQEVMTDESLHLQATRYKELQKEFFKNEKITIIKE
jgi:hypothetical protein